MTALGHDQFAVGGHDRGSYYALRIALEHPDRVTRWHCWTVCRSVSTSTARTPGSPARCGTGSSSFNLISPSASSTLTPTPGTAGVLSRGARRVSPSGALRSVILPSCAACWKTTAPGWASTQSTSEQIEQQGAASNNPSWCCGRPGRPRGPVRRPAGHLAELSTLRHRTPRRLRSPHGRGRPLRSRESAHATADLRLRKGRPALGGTSGSMTQGRPRLRPRRASASTPLRIAACVHAGR